MRDPHRHVESPRHSLPALTRTAALVFASLMLTAAPAHAAVVLHGGGAGSRMEMTAGAQATIEFFQFFDNAPPSGWVPVMVRVRNDASVARTWTVRFQTDADTNCTLGEWPLSVPAGEQREFPVYVPIPWLSANGSYHAIVGRITGPGVAQGQVAIARNYLPPNRTAFTGMSVRLSAENWSRLENELKPSGSGPGAPARAHATLAGSRFNPALVPADWRSYAGFETLWLHRDEWIALSADRRLALLRWVAQGGRLYLAGVGAGLEDLPPLPEEREFNRASWYSGRYGLGTITRLPTERIDGTPVRTEAEAVRVAGDPRIPILVMASEIRTPRADAPALGALDNEIPNTDIETAIGQIRPGGVLLGLFVVAIAVLLGPVNVFVFAPAKRRARLFLTVPIIALGGALALVALILVQDGTGGQGRRGTLITLLPDRPEALVLQEQCVKTGLVVGRTFTFPEDGLLVDYSRDIPRNRYAFYGSNDHRAFRSGLHRRGDRFDGAWFTSRSVLSHHARRFVPTRAALTLEAGADGQPTVISTCPGTLRHVTIVDDQHRRWHAAEVPPGRKIALTPGFAPDDNWRTELTRFGVSLAAAARHADDRPRSFRATADAWDETVPLPTLDSMRWRDDRIFVTGAVRTHPAVE